MDVTSVFFLLADPEAGEDDDAAQYGGENGSEYEDEGDEDGDDDIANLMKKYGDVTEDQD
jgi:hypothetical protein